MIENNLLSGLISSGNTTPVGTESNDPAFTQEYNDAYNFAFSK